MSEKWEIRAPLQDEIDGVTELLNKVSQHFDGRELLTAEELWVEWSEPGTAVENDIRVVVGSDGRLIAYAEFYNNREPPVRPSIYCCIDPDLESSYDPGDLLAWCEKRAREDILKAPAGARVTMVSAASSNNLFMISAWLNLGFEEDRRSHEMTIEFDSEPPAPRVPPGYTIRPMTQPEQRAVYETMTEAFADHYGVVADKSDANYARWRHYFLEGPDHDPELNLILETGSNEIVGGCLCHPSNAGDQEMGWVTSLAVSRNHRRRGLGEALLRHSFQVFYQKGKKRAGLGVDADSLTNATRLYTKCGMSPQRTFVELTKVIRDGTELANLG